MRLIFDDLNQSGLELPFKKGPVQTEICSEYIAPLRGPEDNLRTVASCIYCNSPSKLPNGIGVLTKEHIIPGAIGGTLVISNAACQACMNIISSYETKVLADLFWTPAKALDVRPARRKKPLKGHSMRLFVGDSSDSYSIPLADNPSLLVMPLYHPPRHLILDATTIVDTAGLFADTINDRDDMQANFQKQGFTGYATVGVDKIGFSKFLCKIAYGLAVAKFGIQWPDKNTGKIGGFDVLIRDFLLEKLPKASKDGKTKYDYSFLDFVGAVGNRYEHASHLHGASVRIEKHFIYEYMCAYIQLFANRGAPIYKILVARRQAL